VASIAVAVLASGVAIARRKTETAA
jgi:hypothetical protein